MLFARKLVDSFIDNLDSKTKDTIYTIAESSIDESLAYIAILYEKYYKDYPSGIVVDIIQQHLHDKLFQFESEKEKRA